MKVLITGGTGDHQLRGVQARAVEGLGSHHRQSARHRDLGLLGARWIQADYHDPDALAKAVYGMSFDVRRGFSVLQ
jgi:uncharacterized protein YbjT (DUF2867 family)